MEPSESGSPGLRAAAGRADTAGPFDVASAIDALARTPRVLAALTYGVPEAWLAARPTQRDWDGHQVVCHLLHTEESVWLARAKLIVAGGGRPFPWTVQGDPSVHYPGRHARALIARFRDKRLHSLVELDRLQITAEMLDLEGVHPSLGRVSLRQLLAAWVVHDHNHLRQLEEAMASFYATEVGVWRRLLGILDRTDS